MRRQTPSRKSKRPSVQAHRVGRKAETPAGKAPPPKGGRVDAGILKLRRALLSLAGIVKDLPPDFARNHDYYIHGAPKK